MAGTPTQVEGVLLGDTAAAIFAVPEGRRMVVKSMVLCNLDSASQDVSVYSVASGDTAGPSSAVIHEAVLAPGSTANLPMTASMGEGDQIVARAGTAGKVSFTASGLLYDEHDEPVPEVLHRGIAPTSAASPIYACPPSTAVVVKHLTVCNLTGAERWVSVYLVSAGGAVGGEHCVIRQKWVPARSTLFEAMSFVLGPGDAVYAEASAAGSLNLILSGLSA